MINYKQFVRDICVLGDDAGHIMPEISDLLIDISSIITKASKGDKIAIKKQD